MNIRVTADIQTGPQNARVHFFRSLPQLPRNPFNTRRESVKCSLPILPARSRGLVCPCTHKGLTSASSHLLHSFQPASTSKRALGPLFRPLPSFHCCAVLLQVQAMHATDGQVGCTITDCRATQSLCTWFEHILSHGLKARYLPMTYLCSPVCVRAV